MGKMKRVLLLSTGGTIASAPGEEGEGLTPQFSGEEMIKLIPELKDVCYIDCLEVLNIDSSNMQPENWQSLARAVYDGLQEYDGVVITHGTDTMAYTSSALSFMLKNLNKPVILTGSQVPIESSLTDGKKNIYDAFKVATSGLAGVYLVFNGKIILGTRASKLYARKYDAFHSINYPDIGYVEGDRVYINISPSPDRGGKLALDDRLEPNVFVLKLTPGVRAEIFTSLLQMGYRGVVLEAFGLGGIPHLGRNLLPGIEKLLAQGVPLVVTTQCLYDGVDLDVYDVGVKALRTGVIPSHDMVREAVVAKLMWILGHTQDLQEVKEMMHKNYRGEIRVGKG